MFLVLIGSKFIFLNLILQYNPYSLDYSILYVIILLSSLIAMNYQDIVHLLIYSGSLQLCFIYNVGYVGYFNFYDINVSLYILLISGIYYTISIYQRYKLYICFISSVFYMAVGIPPFINFFNKFLQINVLKLTALSLINIVLLFVFIFSSIFISYIYFNYLHNFNHNISTKYTKLYKNSLYLAVFFVISSLYYFDYFIYFV